MAAVEQYNLILQPLWPKLFLLQTFVVPTKTVCFPDQNLEPIPAFVGEDKQLL